LAANFALARSGNDNTSDEALYGLIAKDLELKGYSIRHCALPEALSDVLTEHALSLAADNYEPAGIGRGETFLHNDFVRTDEICWITGESNAGMQWINWTSGLQQFLNRKLFLGLFSFESHFAHYAEGQYYKRHVDAFKGEANRVLSLVVYLNPSWTPDDGGELVLYKNVHDLEGTKVSPLLGTIVTFLSEEFPHEVLPAKRDRHSIAGWFRVNTSQNGKIDPPR
jgi:SM-20-related protein